MASFLPAESFPAFLEALVANGELHGPCPAEDGMVSFQPLHSPEELLITYSRTLLPPKKYLLPPRETILSWSDIEGYRSTYWEKKIVLLGLHPCDLASISYLDRVFLAAPADPFYARRRAALTLVGFSCAPDEYCFCDSTGWSDDAGFNYDLFLHVTSDGFFVMSGTPHGKDLHEYVSWLMEDRALPELPSYSSPEETAIRKAAATCETFRDSPLWQEFASSCLSCGACSLCCPTCYCFDTREYGELDAGKALRLRDWDNCLFRTHGEIAGGHNFRLSRIERFHYRYQHKYLGFGPTRGVVSCVGCGRCREVCPVRIDLLRLFTEQ